MVDTDGLSYRPPAGHSLTAVFRLPIFLIVVYYLLNFARIIGGNTTILIWLTTMYGFGPKNLGLPYLCGIVGVLGGWLLVHWLLDTFGNIRAHGSKGRLEPEARLTVSYMASVLMAVGVLVLGFALQRQWHYMVLAVFAAMQCTCIMIATTSVNAYLLE